MVHIVLFKQYKLNMVLYFNEKLNSVMLSLHHYAHILGDLN